MHEQFGTRASVESPPLYRNVGKSTLADHHWADRWGTPTEAHVAKTYLYTQRGRTMSRAAGVAGGGAGIAPEQQPEKGSPLSPLQDPLLVPSRPGTPAKRARADGPPSPMRFLTAPEGRRSGEVEMATSQPAAAAAAVSVAAAGEEVLNLDEQADRSFLEKTAARMHSRMQGAAAGWAEGSSSEDEDIWRSSQRAQARMQGRAEQRPTEEAASEHHSVSTTERRPGGERGDDGGGRRPVQRGTTTSYGQHGSRETHSSSEFNLDQEDELMLRDLASTDLLVIGRVQTDDLNAVD